MLEVRPGAYILLGNGPTAALHNPAYDFNDEACRMALATALTCQYGSAFLRLEKSQRSRTEAGRSSKGN